MKRLLDDDGSPLAATFEAVSEPPLLACILHSAGGGPRGTDRTRNRDYPEALTLLLRRLASLRAKIVDINLDSSVARQLPPPERRLTIAHQYPIDLSAVTDYDELRNAITRAQSSTARRQQVKPSSGGNGRKRVKLSLDIPGHSGVDAAERLEMELGALSVGNLDEARPDGQGRTTDSALNRAIELAAVAAATSYYESLQWKVEDVGRLNRGYDLLCTQGLERIRHVEVKGTTSRGSSVYLTPNEVAHALANPGTSALFILHSVDVGGAGKTEVSGGTVLVRDPWHLDPQRLTPTSFTYSVD